MRPVTLTIEGLRSFRRRVEVDFGDRQLLAIVGDTGVGKSSLLEAITYALYSGTTWTAHYGGLLCDTTPNMLVELTFLADGKTYTVTRTASRSRPATAKLHCHEDDRTIDNVRPVDAEIERLIGLDRDTFLKSVILPQGRFAELLTSRPADRNKVLRNIFRVDVLDEVRNAAKTVRDRVDPQVQGLEQRRVAMPADPTADLAAAEADKERAVALVQRLREAKDAAEHADGKRRAALERIKVLHSLATELDGIETSDLVRVQIRIAERETEIARDQEALQARATDIAAQLDDLRRRRAAETADGLDSRHLAQAQTTLESIIRDIPELTAALAEIDKAERALREMQAATPQITEQAGEARARYLQAKADREEAAGTVQQAEARLRDAGAQLDRTVEAVEAAADAEDEVRQADARLTTTRTNAEAAHASFESAKTRAEDAEQNYEHALHQDAAARAAEGVAAGDPCPVCDRSLPDGFQPPKAVSTDEARSERKQADKTLAQAVKDEAAARQSVEDALERLDDTTKRRTEANQAATEAIDGLAKALGTQVVDLDMPREELLAEFQSALNAAHNAHDTARSRAEEVEAAASAVEGEAIKHDESIKAETLRVSDLRRVAVTSLTKLARGLDSLPDRLRPDIGDTSELDALDLDRFVPEPVVAAEVAVSERLDRLAEIDEFLEVATEEHDKIAVENNEISLRADEEVTIPRGKLAEQLAGLAATLKSIGDRLGDRRPAVTTSPSDVSRSIQAVDEMCVVLTEKIEAELVEREEAASRSTEATRTVLTDVGADDLDTLARRLTEVGGQVRDAEKAASTASRAIKVVAQIDQQLGVGRQLVNDLDRLRQILGRFTAAVLSRRSQALLAVAGQRLKEMTGDRFEFTPDFDVLDTLTGQPRGTDTLSGGESFLASLALALGMVDLAARAGGRLDALFLDEGFGALDNTNLNAAIDALETTAAQGRMVGVISHVKGVADRIEDVLLVVGATRGSDVMWLDDARKSELREHDVAAAVGGLLE